MLSVFQKMIARAMHKAMLKKGEVALRNMEEHTKDAMGSNEALLMHILKQNSDTEF